MSAPITQATPPVLALDAVTVGYRGRPVLGDVTASVPAGRLVALVGPNGAGKSTLLRSVAGLQPLLGGRVLLDGAAASDLSRRERARRLAVVLTDRITTEHLRVRQLVALGRHPHHGLGERSGAEDAAVAMAALTRVGAGELADRLVAELSDGQRQRVLVARALAQQPRVLLLDEPTSFLDPAGRIGVWLLLRSLADEGMAVLVCTHEVELALAHCDALWVASYGVVASGTADELVADGRLAAPFETPHVRFNTAERRFEEVRA